MITKEKKYRKGAKNAKDKQTLAISAPWREKSGII
jgi:hypothetical protein